ncbi:Hsp20/alpha crystallin family protein [Halorussus ruber]|uniref:Hsp20/alpha crystallin family protein n=1 Tax=Halorussus ruber TaxID=1126238 RepID=UPI0010929FFC|nr:Hsp20/alpha crystallin family protein [Halorussus ruber]
MAGRRNPFEEIEEMMNRMSRQFEGMGGSDLSELTGQRGGTSIDLAERDDEFVVTADLPGFEKDDIGVSLRGDQLRIDAEHEEAREEGDEDEEGRYLRKERRHQSVSRSVSLPGDVDEEGVSAQFRNGVLTVTLPKLSAGEEDSRQIDIS